MVELCHFGDNCAPGIIIDEILKIRKKTLFMLGMYSFNDILFYLKDCNYEKIYDKENLIIMPNKTIKHTTYNFKFNHEYKVMDSQMTNYDYIRDRFDLKIKNFKEMLSAEHMCIFITFSNHSDELKISDMLEWLSLNKKSFYLIIFTNNTHDTAYNSNNCSIIYLNNSFDYWWLMNETPKMILYREIYEKFIACLSQHNIEHNFPLVFTPEDVAPLLLREDNSIIDL